MRSSARVILFAALLLVLPAGAADKEKPLPKDLDGSSGRGTFTSNCCAGSGKDDGAAGVASADASAAFSASGISKARSISF